MLLRTVSHVDQMTENPEHFPASDGFVTPQEVWMFAKVFVDSLQKAVESSIAIIKPSMEERWRPKVAPFNFVPMLAINIALSEHPISPPMRSGGPSGLSLLPGGALGLRPVSRMLEHTQDSMCNVSNDPHLFVHTPC
jgi:hypothetical protein